MSNLVYTCVQQSSNLTRQNLKVVVFFYFAFFLEKEVKNKVGWWKLIFINCCQNNKKARDLKKSTILTKRRIRPNFYDNVFSIVKNKINYGNCSLKLYEYFTIFFFFHKMYLFNYSKIDIIYSCYRNTRTKKKKNHNCRLYLL